MQSVLPPSASAQVGHADKTSKGPRALGLLELAPNGKARLIPIAILIDGKYYDASAYKADPVPMALWSDTVYEAIHTGVSLGLFTVTSPLQAKDESGATVWWAEGRWQTADSIKAMAAKKKPVPSTPRGMNDDEGPPVLLRRAGAEKPEPPPAPPTPQPTPATSAGSPATTPAATPPAATAPTSSSPATPPQQEQAQADNPPEDKDRPSLKRGKAGAVSAEEAQKKAATSTSAKAVIPATPSTSTPTISPSSGAQPANQTQLIPAISDPHPSDSLPYSYKMSPQEEQAFRKKMLAMAADEIRARATPPPASAAKPVHTSPQRGKAAAAKLVQPIFEDVQLHVFDLADINEPELVLTATAHMPQTSHSANPDLQYMITLVVREDVNGNLHKALANVTDNRHLDVIPRLDLIDAVDVDGDGRAELLFREVSDTSSAFVIYRVIGDQLYPLFQGSLGE